MNQADVTKLMSKLRIKVNPRKRNLKNPAGPEGRLLKIRKTLTALIKHERIELNLMRADETRGYVERLISDAIRYGDCHKATMELADYFLLEKQLVHKLFKVLVPRFENCPVSYTRMFRAPRPYPGHPCMRSVLELRGNPYPPLVPDLSSNRNLIHNVLLDEARREFRMQQYEEISEKLDSIEEVNPVTVSKSEDYVDLKTVTSEEKSEQLNVDQSLNSENNVLEKNEK